MQTVVRFIRRHYWWLIPVLIADILFFRWLYFRRLDRIRDADETLADHRAASSPVAAAGLVFDYPTDQTRLHLTNDPTVYMPTASGRVASALYGSVRTVQRGGRLQPRFHAGIDIAPLDRDRSGAPRDAVRAVAGGRVLTVNPIGGNSSYGIYIVLVHDDRVGEIYTLYAHLADVADGIVAGAVVERGRRLGRMGNTASTGIPMARAHLHFEIGILLNRHFESWGTVRHDGLNHGIGHGWNLSPVDPLAVFGQAKPLPRFCMATHLAQVEPAFVLVFNASARPDYFDRYPRLWRGRNRPVDAIVMAVSEAGTPLWGRAARESERSALTGARTAAVIEVNPDVLGRNGRRLILQRGGRWTLTSGGERWLDILTWDG